MTLSDLSTVRTLIVVFAVLFFVYWLIRHFRPSGKSAAQPNFEDCVHYGASLIDDGYEYFPDWSASMRREFGDVVRPKLENYYQIAKSVAQHPPDKWSAIIQDQLTASRTDHPDN